MWKGRLDCPGRREKGREGYISPCRYGCTANKRGIRGGFFLWEWQHHAYGHDMHTAMLLGAAKLLKKHEDEIQGTVKLMFQPAEEIFEGSQDMIENGLLKAPKVDAAFMIHVMAGMPFQAGTIIVSAAGVGAPAVDYFEFKVQGTG